MRKVVQKKVRRSGDGLNIAADINAVVATSSSSTAGGGASVSREQSVRIVQKNGRTEVTEETTEG